MAFLPTNLWNVDKGSNYIVTRDLPMLWPQPTNDGFMMTCPSVFNAGREGATSPSSGRKHSRSSTSNSSMAYCPI